MFCTCIIVVDLIFIYFRFYLFRIEINNITSKLEFPPLVSIIMPPCLNFDNFILLLLPIKCRSLDREISHLPMHVVTTTVQKKICTGAGLKV